MRIRRRFVMALLAAGLISTARAEDPKSETPAEAKAPTVAEIVERANRAAYYQGRDGRAKVSMTITDSQGRKRKRQFTILRKDEQPADDKQDKTCADQKFYIYFHRPADVKRTTFLVWKHVDRDDDRWMYLPALDLVRRVAASDQRSSFVGSHFFYEDVSGRSIKADKHELVKTTNHYYVIVATPRDPKAVEFSQYKAWIHRKTFLPVKMKFFDKQGKAYRLYEALKVATVDGRKTVTKARMQDLRTKGETVITYSQVKYDTGLPDNIFTERYLRNPPKKQIR